MVLDNNHESFNKSTQDRIYLQLKDKVSGRFARMIFEIKSELMEYNLY